MLLKLEVVSLTTFARNDGDLRRLAGYCQWVSMPSREPREERNILAHSMMQCSFVVAARMLSGVMHWFCDLSGSCSRNFQTSASRLGACRLKLLASDQIGSCFSEAVEEPTNPTTRNPSQLASKSRLAEDRISRKGRLSSATKSERREAPPCLLPPRHQNEAQQLSARLYSYNPATRHLSTPTNCLPTSPNHNHDIRQRPVHSLDLPGQLRDAADRAVPLPRSQRARLGPRGRADEREERRRRRQAAEREFEFGDEGEIVKMADG